MPSLPRQPWPTCLTKALASLLELKWLRSAPGRNGAIFKVWADSWRLATIKLLDLDGVFVSGLSLLEEQEGKG